MALPTKPVTSYLDDEDEDMPSYLDDSMGMMAPPANSPMGAPPIAPQQTPTGLPSIDPSKAIAARKAVADQYAAQPMAQKPRWWQAALAGLAGGAAGYVNAGGRVKVDPSGLEKNILFPGLQRNTANWQKELEAKQAQADLEDANLKSVEGARKAQTEEQYKQAEEELARKRGAYYEGRNAAAEANKKETEAEKDKARIGRAFGELTKNMPVVYRAKGDAGPDGWQQVPIAHPDMKGMVAYTPPPIAKVPKELVPYLPGTVEGQLVDRNTLNAATTKYQAELEKKNLMEAKPDKEVSNAEQVLLNPGNYTPAQQQTARGILAQRHPNSAGGGEGAANVPARNPALPPQQRDEGVLASQPSGVQSVIKQLVDYKYQLPTGIALSKPYWQNILQLAAQYDPSFDASQYSNRMALRKDFMSGKSAQAINSLNTVTQHVDQLEKNWDKLNNVGGAGTALNAPINWVGGKVSGDLQNRLNRFQLDQEAVSNELMRVWRQVGASESEIKQWSAKLSPNLSPEAQKGAIQEIMELIKGKITALKSQYETGMGRPADFHMVQPDTVKRFQKHGVDVQDLAPGATYQNAQPGQAAPPAAQNQKREQHSPSTGLYRHSLDGGQTWQPGPLPK